MTQRIHVLLKNKHLNSCESLENIKSRMLHTLPPPPYPLSNCPEQVLHIPPPVSTVQSRCFIPPPPLYPLSRAGCFILSLLFPHLYPLSRAGASHFPIFRPCVSVFDPLCPLHCLPDSNKKWKEYVKTCVTKLIFVKVFIFNFTTLVTPCRF